MGTGDSQLAFGRPPTVILMTGPAGIRARRPPRPSSRSTCAGRASSRASSPPTCSVLPRSISSSSSASRSRSPSIAPRPRIPVAAATRGPRAREGRRARRRHRRHRRTPHVDEALMDELARVRDAVKPLNVLLVLDAMTGQEAVNVARGVPGAHRVRRRRADEARRRCARRRRALRQGDHRQARSSSPRSARSSTSSRSSTPTGWRRGSSAWATC